ncbi:hypothetical protein BHF68_02595 [Desulfuribacillus alkaliarsenatis]|uniref:Ribosome maturation factor RimM n=2 Tax=Desulfuribacillus alkaliarsenatis TaxID=766136 RepID=A0A1E5G6H5_9FIRM|nr:hypothetical protein BHF68_02595 [Desulfuribacillus alkaliarsenatis]
MYQGKKLFRVGKIVNTQGIKGELRLVPTTDFPDRFKPKSLFIIKNASGEMNEVELEKARPHKNFIIIKIQGCESINEVEKWKGSELFVTEDNLATLAEGEYFFHQLLGCKVQSEEAEEIGVLDNILQTGANDVYVVKREGKKDLLLPVIDECVKDIDTENKIITVHVMPGLE